MANSGERSLSIVRRQRRRNREVEVADSARQGDEIQRLERAIRRVGLR
jgi:hypothetical protein